MNFTNFITFLLLSGFALSSYSQTIPDSLKNKELNALLILAKAAKVSGKYSESIDNIRKAMDIYSTANRKEGIAYCHNELGSLYKELGKYNNSIDELTKAQTIYQELKDTKNTILVWSNLGLTYYKLQNYLKAIEFFQKAFTQHQAIGNQKEATILLNQIGAAYANWGNYQEALVQFEKAKKIAEKNNLTQLLSSINKSIQDVQTNLANSEKEKTNYDKEKNVKQEQYVSSLQTENLQVKNANLKSIEEIEKLSFENQAKELKLHVIQDRYDRQILINKMKEQSIKLLDVKNKLTHAILSKEQDKLKTQKNIIGIILGVFCIVLFLLFSIYRLYRKNIKAFALLGKQHQEIVKQKEEIVMQNENIVAINKELEYKNELITDSINCAKLIQNAILPSPQFIARLFPESFIFFKPKDIVSGDFFWCSNEGNRVLFVLSDCTGHGVPGGFMSIIGYMLLNKIVKEKKVFSPAEILEHLNFEINTILNQGSENYDGGMDISVCCIDYDSNSLIIGLAGHSLYYVNSAGFSEHAGSIYSVGDFLSEKASGKFSNFTLNLHDNLIIYLFSDGFADQFGGLENIKFSSVRMKQLLSEISVLDMKEQGVKIANSFNTWKGHNKQVDDVSVIGMKF